MVPASHSTQPASPIIGSPLDRVPLLDVGRENAQLEHEISAAMAHVARTGRFVLGPEVQQLEQRIARLCNARHGVGCASGSDALLLSLMALDVGPGDEVVVPSFTFFATASAVWRLGATPIFVDVDPRSFNIDPIAIREAITHKTKAIIPVHLFGRATDMTAIVEIGKEFGVSIIEDAAQALGAMHKGRPVGAIGDVGCFSFYPTKNLGGFGDGGMLTTNSDELADRLRLLRGHGMRPRYYHEEVGINSRLDTLQAVVLNVKLPHLDAWTTTRQRNAATYDKLFREAGVDRQIVLPECKSTSEDVWNQYTIRVPGCREQLRKYLSDNGIGTEIYYPVPLHKQACFASLPQRFELSETERAAREVVSLPIFPHMTSEEQLTVVHRVVEFIRSYARTHVYRDVA